MKMKQFGISVLSAMILLTVASVPWSGQQSGSSYDPWLDYDENGVIDVRELYRLGESYGSLGNAIRNVTIAGHVTAYLRPGGEHISILGHGNWLSDMISIDGYATVTVLIWVSLAYTCECNLYMCDDNGYSWRIERIASLDSNWVKTYDAMNQRIQINIYNASATAVTVELAIYLVA